MLVVAGSSSGCARLLLHGADSGAVMPRDYKAAFVAPECILTDGGRKLPGPPGAKYFLAEDAGSPVLYEFEPAGGATIRNGWADSEGTSFFAWVTRGPGFLFWFPKNAEARPVRRVYPAGAYEVVTDQQGRTQPRGKVGAECPLQKVPAALASARGPGR
jgi:hypothetical protein